MRTSLLKKALFLLTGFLLAGIILAGCKGKQEQKAEEAATTEMAENGKIAKPIAKHIMGRWKLTATYRKQDGQWERKQKSEADSITYFITFHPESKATMEYRATNGRTETYATTWSADEEKCLLAVLPEGNACPVTSLTETFFEIEFDQAYNTEEGKMMDGEFKWHFDRSEQTPAGE